VFVASLEATTSKPSPVPPIEVSGDVHDENMVRAIEMSKNDKGGGTAFKDVREEKTRPLLTTDEVRIDGDLDPKYKQLRSLIAATNARRHFTYQSSRNCLTTYRKQ
jgi:hypothetical protein